MPSWLRLAIVALLVLLGVLATRGLSDRPPPAETPAARAVEGSADAAKPGSGDPQLVVSQQDGELSVHGDTGLPYHDALVAAVRAMHQGRATATRERVGLLGIAVQGDAWDAALAGLRSQLPAGLDLETDVYVINPAANQRLICRQMFTAVTRAPIGFQQAGDRIRTASYAALDRLAEFATDCRDHAIAIVGHSDSTGDAAFNIDLSRRRAQSVADYLTARGVAAARLLVEGAGASQPIGDNATSFGRRQNRRIEFRLEPLPPG